MNSKALGVLVVLVLVVVVVVVMGQGAGCAPRAGPPRDERFDAIGFLEGKWVFDSNPTGVRGSYTEECWDTPRSGLMIGTSRSFVPATHELDLVSPEWRVESFEFLRIQLDSNGIPIYLAAPGGRSPPTAFPMTELTPFQRVVFENPQHDMPTRIIYTLQANGALRVRIEGAGENEWKEWWYTRVTR